MLLLLSQYKNPKQINIHNKHKIYILKVYKYTLEVYKLFLTENEKKIIRILAVNKYNDYSINELAKISKISPNGTYKILNKFKDKGIFTIKPIANIKSYKIDYSNERTELILQLAYTIEKLTGKIKFRSDDLTELRDITKICILFGSYITEKEKPNDLDILFVIKKENFSEYTNILEKVKLKMPLKVHEILQTEVDLKHNLKQQNPAIKDALIKGIILWGSNLLTKVIKDY